MIAPVEGETATRWTRWRAWLSDFSRLPTVHYFVGSGRFLYPINLLALVVGFSTTIMFARLLTTEQYGYLGFSFAVLTLLNFVSLPGLNTVIAQSAAQGFDGVLAAGNRLRLRGSFVGSLVLLGLAAWWWRSHGRDVGICLLVAAAVFPFYSAFDGFWSVLKGQKRFKTTAVLRLIQMGAVTLATWSGLLLGAPVWAVFALNTGALGMSNLVLNWWVRRRVIRNADYRPESLAVGTRLSGLSVLISVETRADPVLMGAMLPFQEVGWFSMASRLCTATMQEAWNVLSQLLFPRLAEASPQEARRRVRKWGIWIWVGFVVLAAGFWAVGLPLLRWVLGPAHRESVALAGWLALIMAGGMPWWIFEVYAYARADERSLWLARAMMTGTHLATLPWLMANWGLRGVLVSNALAQLAGVAAAWWRFRAPADAAVFAGPASRT